MKLLTDEEKAYLRIAYENGYRYVATDDDNKTFFYSKKPVEEFDYWITENGDCMKSLVNFGTSWKDEEPTEILDILTSNECKLKKFTSDYTKKYILDACWHIDAFLTFAFAALLTRCIWYWGDGLGYTLGAFIMMLAWPSTKYFSEWLGVEDKNV